jgi:hypothetical protein
MAPSSARQKKRPNDFNFRATSHAISNRDTAIRNASKFFPLNKRSKSNREKTPFFFAASLKGESTAAREAHAKISACQNEQFRRAAP